MTYSIVGADLATSQVGGAGVSCVGTLPVRVIYGAVPGRGAVHAQAQLGGPGQDSAVMMLGDGVAPADIIAMITSTSFDAGAALRQYGIVDVQGRAAGYTGAQNGAYAGDVQSGGGTLVYSVQGNILTSERVIDNADAAFAGGCDLADSLMRALEAGASDGQGDSRCTPSGIPGDSAFIEVDLPDQSEYLRLETIDTAPQDPIARLREGYDAWRADHPCPVPQPPPGDVGCTATPADGGLMVLVALIGVLRATCVPRRRSELPARRSSQPTP